MSRSTRVTGTLTPVAADERARLHEARDDLAEHQRACSELAALGEVERVAPHENASAPPATLRIAAWNVERGFHVGACAELLRRAGAAVVLLTELDLGMARTGNRHVARAFAEELGHGYAYGVEYLELGLGDEEDVDGLDPTAANSAGFHGNAISAALPLDDLHVIRIETDGGWFTTDTDQPRVGGRMAVIGTVAFGSGRLSVTSVHLESRSDPSLRRQQLGVVLDALAELHGDGPAVIGGDLNTLVLDQDSRWWNWPVPHEPLFELAAEHGFAVEEANEATPTVRLSADQSEVQLPRLDWLLTRGVHVSEPATIPAVGDDGTLLTDHDLVVATVAAD